MRISIITWLYFCFTVSIFATAPEVDNNNGTWTDNFNDQLGSSNLNNVELDVINGSTMLSVGQNSGSQTSVIIDPPSFDAWQTICLNATYSNNTNLTIDVLNGADDTPIVGFQSKDMGKLDADACLDISGIDINTYPTLKIRINHTRGTTAPFVQQLKVNWNPITFLLFDKVAPEEVGAGQSFPYKIRVSANFVDAENVVVWDTLPTLSKGTVTYEAGEDYGQNDEPTLSTIKNPDGIQDTLISHGGKYTASAITVNSVNIPAHSVYWTFDKLKVGKSITLQAFLTAPIGTLDSTKYYNAANAEVSNGANQTTPTVVTTVRSTPAPNLVKARPTLDRPNESRIFEIEGENLVLEGNTLKFFLKDPDGEVDGNNYAVEFRERMYNTVLYDTLGDLLPYLAATPFDIQGKKFLVDGTSQIINGVYTTMPMTIGTTTVPANSVYWDLGTLNPGDSYSMDFKVTLNASIPTDTEITNYAYLDSDQTDVIADELPMKVAAEIGGAGYSCKAGYFPTYGPNEQDFNCSSLDGTVPIIYGDPIQYRLHYRNIGGTTLQDMVFFDRVPDAVDFVSADFQDATLVGGAIYYYTNTDYPDSLVHPPFDYSLLPSPGTGWTATAPATATDVTWVAYVIPQMSAQYFPPANPITQVTALMNVVTGANPINPCLEQKIYNTKIVEINAETPEGGSKTAITPVRTSTYTDTTSVRSNIGEFSTDATDISLTPIALIPGNANYSINIKNLKSARSDYFNQVLVQLDWTAINVNGVATYPTFINATGGNYTNFDPVNGTVTLDIGTLGQGDEKMVNMELNFPIGTEDLSTYKVTATLTGIDDLCNPVVSIYEKIAKVSGAVTLQVFKDDVVDLIPSGGEIRYELSYRNIGESPSTNTWVTDRIPFRTTFISATAAHGEQVWFTDKIPPDLPANQISVIHPINFNTIQQSFTLGILDDNSTPSDYTDDVWTSPFGDQTTWVAWKVDDPTLTPNILPVNSTFKTVELLVQNDDDGTGDSDDGSSAGTVIFNEAAIFSNQNSLVVGNEVKTTIEDLPGLAINKSSDVEIVTSAESFNWIIDYRNNSHSMNDTVIITDNLPQEVTLNTVHHQWNSIAVTNGQAGTNDDITANANVTIANNPDGGTTVEIKIAGSSALKSDLLSEEGGQIVLNVTPKNGTPSGIILDNEVCGTAQNAISTTFLCDNDIVTVLNPDLFVSKLSSTEEPNSGDAVTYTLLIANRGLHDASGVIIQDILPTGATYIAGSTELLTAGYSVSEPTGGTTLVWNDLQQTTGGTAGTIPHSSVDIYLSYKLEITGNVLDMPENQVLVSTTDPEGTTYPNADTTQVLIPPPDPTINKIGQSLANPGDAVTWILDYHNTRNAPATGVYIIEDLPDFDSDGDADVDFLNTILPSGVVAYYSANTGNPPAFDATNPTGSGLWTTSPGASVNHLAYLVGNMAANATMESIQITAALKKPISGILPPTGTTYSNQVEIFLNETEGDITNNRDTFETQVPGVDVTITKTGSIEGGFLGLRPGDPISYNFTIKNNGTVSAYGLSITDQLPSNFVPAEPFDEFTSIEVYDAFGLPTDLLDPADAAITISVEPTRTGTVASDSLITWFLGTTANTADSDHYRNVGIPVSATVSFTINGTVAGDAINGDKVKNEATVIYEGIPSNSIPEYFLANNTDSTSVTIYRPDVLIQKSVVDKSTNDENWTESTDTLTYTLKYNNIGNAGADNVMISEIIPEGTTYVDSSLILPPTATVEWFPNTGTPRAFDMKIPFLPAFDDTMAVADITFEVVIDSLVNEGQTQIDNTVSISTTTPELDSNVVNNTAADSIYLRFTDLKITKTVDKAAVIAGNNELLTYTIEWENLGPQEAVNVKITDILPQNVFLGGVLPNPMMVDPNYEGTGRFALIWDLGNQAAGAKGTITIYATNVGGMAGDNLNNIVFIENDRQETDYENNEANALTVIGESANLYLKKEGPAVIDLTGTGQYQLIYGNNGNSLAGNVVLIDEVPTAFRPLAVDNMNCSIIFQTISCGLGDMLPGVEDTVLIDFQVNNAAFLLDSTVTNSAEIMTDSIETDLSDNQDKQDTYITILQLATISGTVWQDDDRNGIIDGVENGIESVVVNLTGTDILGEVISLSTTTDKDGFYAFAGLNPGTYSVEEVQPTGWFSSPYEKLGLVLRTINTPQDTLKAEGTIGTLNGNDAFETIILESGYRGVAYNFGEDLGSIGDTVWVDNNVNGIYDTGEEGVEGVTIRLYQSSNDSLIGTETTNGLGFYLFENLFANDYYAVFDLATLPDSIDRVTIQNSTEATTFTDSDADPTTGTTMVINLAAGEDDLSWDMGIYGVILIGDYVWIDTNKDGIQDGTDVPLEGINVTLFNNLGDSITTVQTDTNGYYYFHTDTLALAGNGNDTILYPNTDYYLAVGLGNQFNKDFGLLFDSLQVTLDSVGNDLTDSNGELAFNIDPDFDGFPFLKITTPTFGAVDTTFDFGFKPADFDYGDLPDTSAVTNASDYQTLESNSGPSHVILAGLSLGNTVDAENDGQPNSTALGDGADEDGLTILNTMNISPGGQIRLPFSYTNTTDTTAYLKIWIDWDGDGKFKTTGEEVINLNDETTPFSSPILINVPETATTGILLGMRVRLSLNEITSPYGLLPNGEVEDYLIGIDCPQVCLPVESQINKE